MGGSLRQTRFMGRYLYWYAHPYRCDPALTFRLDGIRLYVSLCSLCCWIYVDDGRVRTLSDSQYRHGQASQGESDRHRGWRRIKVVVEATYQTCVGPRRTHILSYMMGEGAETFDSYYRIFTSLYSTSLLFPEEVMTNSSWTQAHIVNLINDGRQSTLASILLLDSKTQEVRAKRGEPTEAPARFRVVFPPCDTEGLQKLGKLDNRAREMVSLAQFRSVTAPEKDRSTI